MKSIVSLLFLSAILLAACQPAPKEGGNDTAAADQEELPEGEMELYSNSDYGFRLRLPVGADVEDSGDQLIVRFLGKAEPDSCETARLRITIHPNYGPLDYTNETDVMIDTVLQSRKIGEYNFLPAYGLAQGGKLAVHVFTYKTCVGGNCFSLAFHTSCRSEEEGLAATRWEGLAPREPWVEEVVRLSVWAVDLKISL